MPGMVGQDDRYGGSACSGIYSCFSIAWTTNYVEGKNPFFKQVPPVFVGNQPVFLWAEIFSSFLITFKSYFWNSELY